MACFLLYLTDTSYFAGVYLGTGGNGQAVALYTVAFSGLNLGV